jgi:hypothetical protein
METLFLYGSMWCWEWHMRVLLTDLPIDKMQRKISKHRKRLWPPLIDMACLVFVCMAYGIAKKMINLTWYIL